MWSITGGPSCLLRCAVHQGQVGKGEGKLSNLHGHHASEVAEQVRVTATTLLRPCCTRRAEKYTSHEGRKCHDNRSIILSIIAWRSALQGLGKLSKHCTATLIA